MDWGNAVTSLVGTLVGAVLALAGAWWFGDVRATRILIKEEEKRCAAETARREVLLAEEIEANIGALRRCCGAMPALPAAEPSSSTTLAYWLVSFPRVALGTVVWDNRTPDLVAAMSRADRLAVSSHYEKLAEMREIVQVLHVLQSRMPGEMSQSGIMPWSGWHSEAGKLSERWRDLLDDVLRQKNPLGDLVDV